MRTVKVGETNVNLTRVYFDITLIDNKTPALSEAGFQPLLSQNGGSFSSSGIGVLTAVGYGKYYAQIDATKISVEGDILQSVYQRVGVTDVCYGDTLQVITEDTVVPANQATTVTYYGSVVEADLYFSQKLNTALWVNSLQPDKVKALKMATDAIDRLNYAGDKLDPAQLLQFPRRNDYVNSDSTITSTLDANVPQDILSATYIIAYKFLDGWDADLEIDNLSTIQHKMNSSLSSYDRSRIPDYIRAGIPSASAWAYLRPYLRDPLTLTLSRTS